MSTTPAPQPAPQARPAAWFRALLVAVLVTALAALGGLANAGTASADTGASFEGCPQLDEGDTGPCVAELQKKLTKVHPEYNLPGSETFGPATRIALLDFQGRNHLGADGRFGTTTARELDRQYAAANVGGGAVASPRPKPVETTPEAGNSLPNCPQLDLGDTGPCVAQLQQLLNKVHPEYQLPGSQTYGPQTQAAVRDFQERNHITGGNGQFGPGTAKALQDQAAQGTPKTAPGPTKNDSDRTPCPPKPGKNASKQEKEEYAVALYTGCEQPKPKPWSKRNCGNINCSTYYSRHAVKVTYAANADANYWQIVQDSGMGVACEKMLKGGKLAGPGWWCAGATLLVAFDRELSKDAYAEAARKDTCVKETLNMVTQGITWEATSRDNKYCSE